MRCTPETKWVYFNNAPGVRGRESTRKGGDTTGSVGVSKQAGQPLSRKDVERRGKKNDRTCPSTVARRRRRSNLTWLQSDPVSRAARYRRGRLVGTHSSPPPRRDACKLHAACTSSSQPTGLCIAWQKQLQSRIQRLADLLELLGGSVWT